MDPSVAVVVPSVGEKTELQDKMVDVAEPLVSSTPSMLGSPAIDNKLRLTSSVENTSVAVAIAKVTAHLFCGPVWGQGTPLPPLSIYFSFSPFYFSLSFIGFTYFLLLSIPSLSTRIVPLPFQARGRRRRSNLGLVNFFLFCTLCYLYSLVKMYSSALFYLV